MSVLSRIANDLNRNNIGEIYFINNTYQINLPNQHPYESMRDIRFGKKYIDGGVVVCNQDSFQAYYNLDFQNDEGKKLVFQQFQGELGKNFISFIHRILEEKSLLIQNGIKFQDLKMKLFVVSQIEIHDAMIDQNFISYVSKYFHSLKEIKFINCRILSEVSFQKWNIRCSFHHSQIDDILVFRDTLSPLDLESSCIQKVTPCDIFSSEILFRNIGNHDKIPFSDIFLKCNFPYLKDLTVLLNASQPEMTHESGFTFLPDSCPNLESLYLEGKVSDLSFLKRLMYLNRCGIKSKCDNSYYSFFYPYITDGKERKRLEKARQQDIKYIQKQQPFIPKKVLSTLAEYYHIMNQKDFYYLISLRYSNELDELIQNDLSVSAPQQISHYFLVRYQKLNHVIQSSDFLPKTEYCIQNSILYQKPKSKNEIVLSKEFLYHSSGIPILFDSYSKYKPKSYEELNFLEPPSISEEEEKKIEIEKIFQDESICTFGDFSALLSCEDSFLSFQPSDFSQYSVSLTSLMHQNKRQKEVEEILLQQNEKAFHKLLVLFEKMYSQLTIQEKNYIFSHIHDFVIRKKILPPLDFQESIQDSEKLKNKIQEKSQNQYLLILNQMKKSYKAYYVNRMDSIWDQNIEEEMEKIRKKIYS